MKRFFLVLVGVLAFTAVMAQAADSAKSTGWISDSMCGAKHMGTGSDCVKKCIEGGMKPVFVDAEKQVWAIDNPDAVKRLLWRPCDRNRDRGCGRTRACTSTRSSRQSRQFQAPRTTLGLATPRNLW